MGGMVQLPILKLQKYASWGRDTEELQQATNNPIHTAGTHNSVHLDIWCQKQLLGITGWGCNKRRQRANTEEP